MFLASKREIRNPGKRLLLYISLNESKLEECREFLDELDKYGFNYYLYVKSKENLDNDFLVEKSIYNCLKADVGIIVLDDETLNDPQMYNYTMHEAGVLIGKKLMLYNGGLSLESLNLFSKSPIRDVQLASKENIIEAVKNFITLPLNIFKDESIDCYTRNRIFYVKFVVMLDLRYNSLLKIYERLSKVRDDITLNDVYTMLEESVMTGIRVLHFGQKISFENIGYWPYHQEMKRLDLDFPLRSMFSKIKTFKKIECGEKVDPTDLVGSIKMEFVVPNNEILGVSFLPFFEIQDNDITPSDLVTILVDDGLKKEQIVKKIVDDKVRVYFPLNIEDGRLFYDAKDDVKEEYSETVNYFYPK